MAASGNAEHEHAAILSMRAAHDAVDQRAQFLSRASSMRSTMARSAMHRHVQQQQLVEEPQVREREEARGISGISGMAGGAPPIILAMPTDQM